MRSAPIAIVLGLVSITGTSACRVAPKESGERAPRVSQLTLDDVFELDQRLKLQTTILGWTPDGSAWLTVDGGRITAVDVASGERRTFLDPAALERACTKLAGVDAETARAWSQRTEFTWDAQRTAVLWNERNDLWSFSLATGAAARLTSDERTEEGESFSPDGKLVAWVAGWNLWVAPADGSAPGRALSTAGDADHLHGRLDWIYQEEVYGRGNFGAFWWSPDSARIAYLTLDESDVPTYVVTDPREIEATFQSWRYPKPGDPNPRVGLSIVDVATGATRAVDLGPWAAEEPLVVRVSWKPDSSALLFQVQDRPQTWLDLVTVDPATGATRTLLRDETDVWIEPLDGPFWVDGERFLLRSERDGWAHLYLHGADGGPLGRVTEGRWEVDSFVRWDETSGFVYFLCDRDDVMGAQLWRARLDGGGLERVTSGAGTHEVSFAPDGRAFLDTYSSVSHWPTLTLRQADGRTVREVERIDPAPALTEGLILPQLLHPTTRDGFEMNAHLFVPPDLDPRVEHPVLCYVYAGPHAPKVKDARLSFDGLFHSMLAQQGYLVWVCDNRSASGKGLESAKSVYRETGAPELADIQDGIDWLCKRYPVDPERIGIWGWSYGGYQTAFALTHSDRFRMGIAGAPVTDWRLYDSIYTERLMGLPRDNPEGYRKSSPLEAAAELSGDLLLIHGVIDENVHMQNTLAMAHELQEAGVPFELMLYPSLRHSPPAGAAKKHLYATMLRFVHEHL